MFLRHALPDEDMSISGHVRRSRLLHASSSYLFDLISLSQLVDDRSRVGLRTFLQCLIPPLSCTVQMLGRGCRLTLGAPSELTGSTSTDAPCPLSWIRGWATRTYHDQQPHAADPHGVAKQCPLNIFSVAVSFLSFFCCAPRWFSCCKLQPHTRLSIHFRSFC